MIESGVLSSFSRTTLLVLARQAIEGALRQGGISYPDLAGLPAELHPPADVFVTLRKRRDLRGCTGNIHSTRALAHEVMAAAVSSAQDDPRFPPLAAEELPLLTIEISILSPFQEIRSADEIIPQRHGVLVQQGARKGLFLPQVWGDTGWDKARFLSELCQSKASLPPDAWNDPGTLMYVFDVEVFAAAVPEISESAFPLC